MGVVLDTSVFVALEKREAPLDFNVYDNYGGVYMSAVTVSELLVGVHYADSDARRARCSAFVESVIANVEVLDFTRDVARVHAHLYAMLRRQGQLIGAHDLMVAATAFYQGFSVLTANLYEFERIDGLQVLPLPLRSD